VSDSQDLGNHRDCPGAFAIGKIDDEQRFDVVRHACPGPGACGGMYTANTMSSALEVILKQSRPWVPVDIVYRSLECLCLIPRVPQLSTLVSSQVHSEFRVSCSACIREDT